MARWHGGKLFIENNLPVSHDSLHVIFGVLVWLAFALLLRRPLTSPFPWLWTLAVILWNETVDLWVEQWPYGALKYGQGIKDVLLTMLVPTAILGAGRFYPQLFGARRPRARRRS